MKIAQIKDRYFIRSGSSFGVASHTQLEDMFGRRPKPVLKLHKRIVQRGGSGNSHHVYVFLGIENIGRGVAKAPYLSVKIEHPHQIYKYGIDGNGNFGLRPRTRPLGTNDLIYGSSANEIIHPGVALDITAVWIEYQKRNEIFDLVVKYNLAAEGINLFEGVETIASEEIWRDIQNQP